MTGILIVPKPKARRKKARYRKAIEKWEKLLDEETEALREAQRITAKDLAVTINVRGSDP
jgi:hypothetical protein